MTKPKQKPEIPFPSKIKIGARDYVLEDWHPTHAAEDGKFGTCDTNYGVIRVCRNHGEQKAATTLIHEIMHAIYAEYSISPDDDEERTVHALSNGMAAVWRDNPAVFAWVGYHLLVDE